MRNIYLFNEVVYFRAILTIRIDIVLHIKRHKNKVEKLCNVLFIYPFVISYDY